ncbi:IclR family transcriptional regulator [Jiangella endophytica]|uniref:IclR family transcriptional regulator n=1 Tax=Jiangella endophytica TaxID=1623398 RepID=UPI000E34BF45|nr:IclR family transcriptional regulator [Jiangella endophytica]
MDTSNDSPSVKSAQRTLRILEVLGEEDQPLSLPELQERTGYPRSSLHALARTLRDAGWLQTDAGGSRYQLGTRALLTGTAYLDKDPAIPLAQKALEDLREELGHTVHFGRREQASVIYLASRESMVAVRQVYRIGRLVPASLTGLGQALLADLTDGEVAELLPEVLPTHTEFSIARRDDLLTELKQVRDRGWALELDQGVVGLGCVAAVVPYRIPGTDAISCSVPSDELRDESRRDELAAVLVRHTHELAAQLRRAGIR